MTIDALIAEITSGGFQQYEESGIIDYISLRRWIKSELKRFGNNLMVMGESILHVDNERAKLPENFWQLYLAVNCELQGYTTDDPEDVLQNSFLFKERIEGTQEWDNMSESYVAKDFKYVKEDLVFNKGKATFYYGNPQFLKLERGFDKSVCAPGCQNLRKALVDTSPNTVNIIGDYLNTNFKKGDIYMQYRGLPTDADGKIIIPTTQHDRLQEYLIDYCRMKIMEDVAVGGDGDAVNLLQFYDGRRREGFMLAMTELKFEGLGKNWAAKLINKQRKETLKYDVMLPRV
jgi:hypothetical protein